MKNKIMKLFVLLGMVVLTGGAVFCQDKLVSRNGSVSFFSKTSIENIEAHSQTAVSVLDKKTGKLEFSVLIKSFLFQKALMQEHFNENYLESDKFPKSTFKGRIDDLSKIDFSQDGNYTVSVSGLLTIHGETRPVTAPASFTVTNGSAMGQAEFNIMLSDYNISIPTLVKDKISRSVKISLNVKYDDLAKPQMN
ncbi:MAG TPA: YceI family protein [Chitinophagaceae bacterium]